MREVLMRTVPLPPEVTMRWVPVLLVTLLIHRHVAAQLPKVERDFNGPARVDQTGKTLAEIIPPLSVGRVILTHNHGVDTVRTPGRKPEYDSDELVAQFFRSPAKAERWGLRATERTLAEFLILTKDGEVYRLEVLQEHSSSGPVTGGILNGKGLRCRFTVAPPADKERKK
jgi:hypothetical protein